MSMSDITKQLTKDEVMEKTASHGIREYGIHNDKLTDIWNKLLKKQALEKHSIRLAAALNNNDSDRVLLDLLRNDSKKVLEGMKIAAYVLDAQELTLYLPESEEKLITELEPIAAAMGIGLVSSNFVDRRLLQESAIHHIVTLAVLAEAILGEYKPVVYAAVKENDKLGKLQRIPYGTKLSELIHTPAENIKGIVIGTKLYDVAALDCVMDEQLTMGNGVITVLPKNSCVIDEAEKRLLSSRKIGCGKCTFCREGLLQLHMMIKDITKGKGKNEYLSLIKEIGEAIPYSTMCSIGQTGADFVLTGMEKFSSEYEDHIKKKKCRASICSAFVPIYIDPERCTGCGDCLDACPEDCIEGKSGYIHMIDVLDCTKCGKCIEKCEEGAIIKAEGRMPKLPDRLVKCGKFKKH